MKQFFFFICALFFAIACNNPQATSDKMASDSTTTDAAATTDLNFPYTLDEPYKDWQPGNRQHAVTVMNMLKAWQSKNAAECASYFGDTVDLRLDYFHKKIAHDSIPAMLESSWADYASVDIKMQDWESVISKDKKDEWVTLWYKQTWVDKKGKTDSMNMVNDAKIVNGKIVVFDEKIQHPPVAGK